ncbi:hypothetical protein ASPZODRAFT_117623 [Penicilliopsis zonata CBS 506.65]|uniref:Uncharacterized protein n=1 Tax=Penicilliopsis zonata CBS 506.65 TaxID=1073090 RepID=A0A1L9SI29_9EURO|nr:hypothetical protein ASPZODRAFT_117623 [Penicilliopsis zonata CBS 506.65]OJJ46787.1 hypothetical protein ASPZODRAFT_117623 [Penicilliopsis zonata CBS 506.65]
MVTHLFSMMATTAAAAAGGAPPPSLPPATADIAVVGMACRFPGADSADAFWDLLRDGRTTERPVPAHRLPLANHWRTSAELGGNARGHFLDTIDSFDNRFFGITAREAAAMDPQQRLLLETAYQALESAGYFAREDASRHVGCYIGGFSTDYNDNIASHRASAFAALGSLKGFQSGRISHFFGWTGPSLTIDTVCSSSGVAIDAACKSLRAGDCDYALAGGVSLLTSPFAYQNLAAASFLSPEGRIKPFDAAADGYSRAEGVGLVVLMPLAAAQDAGHPILGVIRASLVRQSRARNITVPHTDSQATLYRSLLAQAGVEPYEVTYLEAHGTGTRIGDVPEYEGIRQVFGGADRPQTLHFASLKANIGHAEGASGVAALIKTLLMLRHAQIPPQANLVTINPRITNLAGQRLAIPRQLEPWAPAVVGGPRRAVLNNFGAAGSISAVLLQEYTPVSQDSHATISGSCPPWPRYPVCLAAHTFSSLQRSCAALLHYIESSDASLADLCFALYRRANRTLPVRRCFAVSSREDLCVQLRRIVDDPSSPSLADSEPEQKQQPVVLAFGGQSTRRVHVPRSLFDSCVLFRAHLEACDNTLTRLGYPSIFPTILEEENDDATVASTAGGALALQTMQFALQYATARAWVDSGLRVDCLLGHSLGQLVALVVSGSLSLEDGLRFVCGRAALIDSSWGDDPGGMVSIQNSDQSVIETICKRVQQILLVDDPSPRRLEIACHNGPTSHVLVGSTAEISALVKVLQDEFDSVAFKRLDVTHGFHSKLTEPILPQLHGLAQTLSFQPPMIPLEPCTENEQSAVTQLTADALVAHTRQPVFFAAAARRIQQRLGSCVWLEVGTKALGTLRVALSEDVTRHSLYPGQLQQSTIADTTTQLWSQGYGGSFWPFHALQTSSYTLLQLPPYQFDQAKHWLPWNLNTESSTSSNEGSLPKADSDRLLSPLGPSSFRINSGSTEWQAAVSGHRVLGQPTLPASLYLDMVLQAVRQLLRDAVPEGLMPHIDGFRIRSPLGGSQQKQQQLTLHLEHDNKGPSGGQRWQFSFRESAANSSTSTGIPAADGQVTLLPMPDGAGELARTGRLLSKMGLGAAKKQQEDGSVLQQPLIYTLLSPAIEYEPRYRTLCRAILLDDKVVCASGSRPTTGAPTLPIIDACFQAAGLHANAVLERTRQPGTAMVCVSMEKVQWHGLSAGAAPTGSLELLAITTASETDTNANDAVYDVFARDEATHEVVLIVSRLRFRRIGRSSLVRKPPSLPLLSMPSSPPAKAATQDRQQANSTAAVQLQKLLSALTDVPTKNISPSSNLASLGIDSLMAAELQREINSSFGLSVSQQELQVDTFGDLVAVVDSRGSPNSLPAGQGEARHSSIATSGNSVSDLLRRHIELPPTVSPSCRLADLGVDSLLAIEIANDLRNEGHSHDAVEITPETKLSDLGMLPVTAAGSSSPVWSSSSFPSPSPSSPSSINAPISLPGDGHAWRVSPQKALHQTTLAFHGLATEAGCHGFWREIVPLQAQLLQAYVLEAFEQMGVDLRLLSPGEAIPNLPVVEPRYTRLRTVLLDLLREGELVDYTGSQYIRSDRPLPLDKPTSATLHERLVREHPAYSLETRLLQVTGPRLAKFLTGEEDPLHSLFGNEQSKQLLTDVYTHSPMFLLMSRLLAHFVGVVAAKFGAARPLRVLEVGAGTGGTTVWLLDSLAAAGIAVEYVFTDISSSLVSAARRRFGKEQQQQQQQQKSRSGHGAGGHVTMGFAVLDIEKPPPQEMLGSFDVVLSTLCVHATRDLACSLANIRQLLRPGGFVALAEFTRRIPWLDLVFGLLDGWWRHSDGRQHALASVAVWHQAMERAGFTQASQTSGRSLEAQTGRIVCGFQSPVDEDDGGDDGQGVGKALGGGFPALDDLERETVCFQQVDDVHLRADIYYPHDVDVLPPKKWPVALLIHGGGHIMLSRRDVPSRQVSWLLDHGILPISIDYRLCPEVSILDGPIEDVGEAFVWARRQLPRITPRHGNIQFDGGKVGVVGWSSGAMLALSTGWTAPSHGVKAPEAAVAFYCPVDYQDEYWKTPNDHAGDVIGSYNLMDGVKDRPVASYPITSSEWMDPSHARSRILIHMIRQGQTLPVLYRGLGKGEEDDSHHSMSQPSAEQGQLFNPYAYMVNGGYRTPTYFVHGQADCFVPWQQAQKGYDVLRKNQIPSGLSLVKDEGHLFDIDYHDPRGEKWAACEQAYLFLHSILVR